MDGACFNWDSWRTKARAMLDAEGDDKLIPFLSNGESDDPELKDLPKMRDLIKGEAYLNAFDTWARYFAFRRPLAAPPGTPPDRVETLRQALAETLQDPEFLAEAEKSDLNPGLVSGETVEGYVDAILTASPETIEFLQFLMPESQ